MHHLGEIRRIQRPTHAEFEELVRRREPVVLEGVLDDWPALRAWSDGALVDRYGDQRLRGLVLREMIERIQAGEDVRRDMRIQEVLFLMRDLRPPPYVDLQRITSIY